MKKTLVFLFSLLVISGTLYAEETLYVQSLKGKLMSEPNFKSEVKLEAKRGDKLNALEKKGSWHRVSAGSVEGWINRLSVSKFPPMNKVKIVKGNIENIDKLARKRSSAITTAAAARGLSDADRRRLGQMSQADFLNLQKLEGLAARITQEEIENFSTSVN